MALEKLSEIFAVEEADDFGEDAALDGTEPKEEDADIEEEDDEDEEESAE